MNANEIMDGLEIEIGKRYGEGHSCSERNVLREAIRIIDENQKKIEKVKTYLHDIEGYQKKIEKVKTYLHDIEGYPNRLSFVTSTISEILEGEK